MGWLVGIVRAAGLQVDINLENPTKFNSVNELMVAIVNYMLWLGGALAVIALVYSGIRYITAGGDTEAAGQARKNLIWAITGIVVIGVALLLINQVLDLLK